MSIEPPGRFESLSPSAARRVRDGCAQFENAWQTGARPRIEDYLSDMPESDRSVLLVELVKLDLKYRWRGGDRCFIETYVARWPELKADAQLILQLVVCECQARLDQGDRPTVAEYCARFPQLVGAALDPVRPLLEATDAGLGPETTNESDTQVQPAAQGPQVLAAGGSNPAMPTQLGRYKVRGCLGEGGFGIVYLARDDQMKRQVAIKVPRPELLAKKGSREAFLHEARSVANLRHEGIVRAYDVGEEPNGLCYIVYEFIDGTNLAEHVKQGPLALEEAVRIVAEVADALDYAHQQDVYHRDVKPKNILLDKAGDPYLTDFGVAIAEAELPSQRGHRAGTYAYMSPEQLRGEGHRIDGRSDIYSLGVVLYELLSGRRPFRGDSPQELLDHIQHGARPPRQINAAVSHELEQICLKAISKQASDRYSTAGDMAQDLRALEWPPPGEQKLENDILADLSVPPIPVSAVIPKGLRSFGPDDSPFFLDLLPGPRDRAGIPESIGFWKRRIESRDPESTFSVGLVYGPSGCGKTSFLRAGLLPRLQKSLVVPVYIEATREDTEARLSKALSRAVPALPPDLSLHDMIARLRRDRGDSTDGRKVLLILDQFEQWLHAHRHDMETSELVVALRQADGENVHALLMVRDDFWMGISRLFDHLDINSDPERNTRVVDLFDLQHARNVLRVFGHAYQRLPANDLDLTKEQQDFLDDAVNELSQEGRVISVRLSLLAELMKARPWTREELVKVGGTEGIGVRFLEETFTSRTAVPEHRALEKPVRALLQALLPEGGTDIKGHMRSRRELGAACGLPENSDRFARLIKILDRELHIITPTEREEVIGDQVIGNQVIGNKSIGDAVTTTGDRLPITDHPITPSATQYYQLTHDYLVPPLRQWLTLERRKTWRGRAELVLEERTAQMSQWPQSRYLPSLIEYLSIAFGVPREKRKPAERALLLETSRFYALRAGIGLAFVAVTAMAAGVFISSERTRSRRKNTAVLVNALWSAPADAVPYAVRDLRPYKDLARDLLQEPNGSPKGLRAAYALADFGDADAGYFLDAIPDASASECRNIVAAFRAAPDSGPATRMLWQRFCEDNNLDHKARYAIVLLQLGKKQAAEQVLRLSRDSALRTAFTHRLETWRGDLTELLPFLRQADDSDLRSGLCAALALIESDAISPAERQALSTLLQELYQNAPDGGTHSASGLALRRWNVTPLPQIGRTEGATGSNRWFVNSQGMTMIEIPQGELDIRGGPDQAGAPQPGTIGPFFVCDREISVALFKKFAAELGPKLQPPWEGERADYSPTEEHPVQQVSWDQALAFCNWLSEQEQRKPCYKMVQQPGVEFPVWECDWGADGYRLLTALEWEYACRSRSETRFFIGDDDSRLHDYAVFGNEVHTWIGATLLPNGWGLFDMLGNVWEWCWDSDPRNAAARVCRGGYFGGPAEQCSADYWISMPRAPGPPGALIGFRVACRPRGDE